MISRRAFATSVILGLLAAPLGVAAQPAKVWRIGYLGMYSAELSQSWMAALQQGLRDAGYVGGQNVVLEARYSEGRDERLAGLAAELVRLKVDVIVAHGSAAQVAKDTTTTIPVVLVAHPDPVGAGLAASLARPGGNVTGFSDFHSGLVAKRLELLREVVPSATRIAVLHPRTPILLTQVSEMRTMAPALGLSLPPLEATGGDEIDRAFATIERERAGALNVLGHAIFTIHRKRIADLAIKTRVPTISTTRPMADGGLLMSYGANFDDLYRRAATYADKILKGAKPGDLPVEQPTKFELVVNMKTAKALGLTIPSRCCCGRTT